MSITMCTVWSKPTYVLICTNTLMLSGWCPNPNLLLHGLNADAQRLIGSTFQDGFCNPVSTCNTHRSIDGTCAGATACNSNSLRMTGWVEGLPPKHWVLLLQVMTQSGSCAGQFSPSSLSSMPKGFWVSSSCAGQMVPSQLALHLSF